jgi:subtilisin family serine protease
MRVVVVFCALAGLLVVGTVQPATAGTIEPNLSAIMASRSAGESVSTLVYLKDRVDIAALNAELERGRPSFAARHETVVRSLQEKAATTQGPLQDYLKGLLLAGRIQKFQPFWLANAIRVDGPADEITRLAERPEVDTIYYNYEIESITPVNEKPEPAGQNQGGQRTPEIGLVAVRAPEVWAMGFDGTGVLVATLDTGVDGNHPALASRWRGLDPQYQGHPEWAWFDPVTNTTFPQAFGSHGTHTMGTVCGGAPGDQVGVAPGAQWIHAAVIDRVDIPTTVADACAAFQWMADPDGNPATTFDVPQSCSNSWGVTTGHGYPPCDQTFWSFLDGSEAAGTAQVFSAGNEGYGGAPETLRRPADRATTEVNCFAVGAIDANNSSWPIADFSSRGPSHCTPDGTAAIKPEVVAPGVNVRSSLPGGSYGYMDGTSMASPHVNGVLALVREACPDLTVDEAKQILLDTAHDLGDVGNDNWYGMGMVDAVEAVNIALSMCSGAPRARDSSLETPVNTPLTVGLLATDYDHLPDPPAALLYIITSLPGVGTLTDPANGHVIVAGDLPYTLIGYDQNQVLYTPGQDFYGTETFQFKANDSGTPPDGGDSNIATVTILVKYGPPVITTESLPEGLLDYTYGPVQLEASEGQPELAWEVLPAGQYYETDLGSSQFTEVGVAQGWHADDSNWAYTLPFSFPYFDSAYTTAYVCSNGFINFGAGDSDYSNSDSELIAAKRIAALWDDLRTDGTGEDIFIDASVPDQVTFRWKAETYSGSNPCNFSIVLYADGRIRFHYGSGNTGLSPTIGVSGGNGYYLLSSYNNAATLTDANSLEFYMPATLPDGMSVSPAGLLSGIPTESGDFEPTFRVTDSLNRSDQKTIPLTINIGPRPPIANDQNVSTPAGAPLDISLEANDDGLPNPPGVLSYIISSLPAHGWLVDPGASRITSAPYTLVNSGHLVRLEPSIYYMGPDDSFTFKANDGGTPPEGGDSNTATVDIAIAAAPRALFSFALDSDPGWSTTGAWAYGQPTGAGSHLHDPVSGYTGTNVYGYNLAGDYTNARPARYLTTTVLNCREVTSSQLRFWRWLAVEATDYAGVEVSTDGATWTSIWSNTTTISEAAWTQRTYDLSALADHQPTVYIRWVMGPSDYSVTYPGWNIDDIELWGLAPPRLPGDLNCDGVVDFADINPFVQVMVDPAAWEAAHPDCPLFNGDINDDGAVDFGDINPFVGLLTGQ